MGYSYDFRVATVLDSAAKTAQKRLGDLKKASDTLKKLKGLGARFDTKDGKKLRNHG